MSEEAAVDDDVFTGNEAASVWSGHQDDGSGEFVRNSERAARIVAKLPAGRSVLADAFDSFRCEDFSVLLGREEAGRQSVDSNAVLSELTPQILREIDDGSFRSRVGKDSGQGDHTAERRDVENRTLRAAIDHVLAENLAGQPDGSQVGVEDVVPLFIGDVEERRCRVGTRSVDQNIGLTTGGFQVSDDGFQVFATGAVRLEEFRRATSINDLVDNRLASFLVSLQRSPDDDDVCSCTAECLAERSTKDARSADHDCGQSIEVKQLVQIV